MTGTTGGVAAATTPEVYVFDPANFPEPRNITNEFYPLEVGTVSVSEVAGVEYTVGTVPDAAFPIAGIDWQLFTDIVYTETDEGLRVDEITHDAYGQDAEGNVIYAGEKTWAFHYNDNGTVAERIPFGSWLAEEAGAQPGVIMPADPQRGDFYYEEIAVWSGAVDRAFVVKRDGGTVVTLNTTAAEPAAVELKTYTAGEGLVKTRVLEDGQVVPEDTATLGNATTVAELSADVPEVTHEDLGGAGTGGTTTVTYRGGNGELNSAVGIYKVGPNGEIRDARLIFTSTEGLEEGASVDVEAAEGETVVPFILSGSGRHGLDIGVPHRDLEAEGSMSFENFSTEGFTTEVAAIDDPSVPLIVAPDMLPIAATAMHALDGNPDDRENWLNPGGTVQATVDAKGRIAFDEDYGFEGAAGGYGDFDDVIVSVATASTTADLSAIA